MAFPAGTGVTLIVMDESVLGIQYAGIVLNAYPA